MEDFTGSSSLFRFKGRSMPLIDLRQARADIHLAVVLDLLGWQARERRGEQVRGGCLVHGSMSPSSRSFSAHLGRNIWRCFVCGAAGNALDLWLVVHKQPLYPALLELYRQLGRDVPWLQPGQRSAT
jgi:CHC2 zinc finger